MGHFTDKIRHRFNPLHVYCRLKDMGLTSVRARRWCAVYERWLYNVMS